MRNKPKGARDRPTEDIAIDDAKSFFYSFLCFWTSIDIIRSGRVCILCALIIAKKSFRLQEKCSFLRFTFAAKIVYQWFSFWDCRLLWRAKLTKEQKIRNWVSSITKLWKYFFDTFVFSCFLTEPESNARGKRRLLVDDGNFSFNSYARQVNHLKRIRPHFI